MIVLSDVNIGEVPDEREFRPLAIWFYPASLFTLILSQSWSWRHLCAGSLTSFLPRSFEPPYTTFSPLFSCVCFFPSSQNPRIVCRTPNRFGDSSLLLCSPSVPALSLPPVV